jgi:hypothetical protein
MNHISLNHLKQWATAMPMFAALWFICLSAAIVPLTGCPTISTVIDKIANGTIAAADGALQVAAAMESSLPALAQEIKNAAQDASQLASALLSGATTEAKVIAALQTLQTLLASVPTGVSQAIAAALPIIIAGIQVLYSLFSPGTAVTTHAMGIDRSPWVGKANIPHRMFRSVAGDYDAAWQTQVVKAYPGSGFVVITIK